MRDYVIHNKPSPVGSSFWNTVAYHYDIKKSKLHNDHLASAVLVYSIQRPPILASFLKLYRNLNKTLRGR